MQKSWTLGSAPMLYYIKQNSRSFWLGILFLLLTNIFDGIGPFILKMGIDQLVEQKAMTEISSTIGLYLGAMLLLLICRYAWRVTFGRYHTEAAEHLRNLVFNHLLRLTPRFFNKNPVGELMSLITNDVNTFRQAIGPGLLILLDALFMSLTIIPLMCLMSLSWTVKTLVILPFVPVLIYFIHKLIHKYFKISQERFAELSGFSQELVAGIRAIKGYAQENNKITQYNKLSKSYEESCNKVAVVDGAFIPVMDFGVTLGSVILIFIATPDLLSGAVSIGTFIAFQRYIERMVWPMTALGIGVSNFQRGRASFDRIKAVLQQEPDINLQGTEELKKLTSLHFENVSFSYPESPTQQLKNISFTLKAGESLGIIGAIGSGKTTLVNLLVRLYEPNSGQILVNEKPIEHFNLESLRRQIRLVPQDVYLFADSVRHNFLFPRKTEEVGLPVEVLAQKVQLHQEIEQLPNQYDAELGERGINLSGGQKQRVSIGRGIAQETSMIILDDSLSAVDLTTEAAINREVLAAKVSGQSLIVVSHRLNNLKHMDKILVLKEGTLEAFGPAAEISKDSETLATLAQLQGVEL